MSLMDRRRIVAIDPTHRGLAFAFFEEGRVRDWGTRRGASRTAALDRILQQYAPAVVFLEDADAHHSERRQATRVILGNLAAHARASGCSVVVVSRREVRDQWLARGVTKKQAAATDIAKRFPELESVLPPTRKIYRSEDARIHIFDAASLVIHALDDLRTS
jgi:hypothetical protein